MPESRLELDPVIGTWKDTAIQPHPGRPVPANLDTPGARQAWDFKRTGYIGPDTRLQDGFDEGGSRMEVGADGMVHPKNGEVIVLDRSRDPALQSSLDYARSLRRLPPKERVQLIHQHVTNFLSPPDGTPPQPGAVGATAGRAGGFGRRCPRLGGGICRHGTPLFKDMAHEAGVPTSMRSGWIKLANGKNNSPSVE